MFFKSHFFVTLLPPMNSGWTFNQHKHDVNH